MTTWALPENIEDVLPAEAKKLERMRRIALDLFATHGYELVMPPLLEYVESLLNGVGRDMDLATFKLVDQLSGRMMGIRADTTPQVARIDAHVLNRTAVTRLCYAGSVLHTRPASLGKSRQPFQVGAELYGYAGIDADIEIQQLMLDTLAQVGVTNVKLDIGHSDIFLALMDEAKLSQSQREAHFAAVTAKDVPTLKAASAHLAALPMLYGAATSDVLTHARALLPQTPRIVNALNQLERVAAHFAAQGIVVSIDLSELGGFNYESGMAFAAYAIGATDAVARGGRYDNIGSVFGRARPAVGFSMDLKSLIPLIHDNTTLVSPIAAPSQLDATARAAIAALRAKGETVVSTFAGEAHPYQREMKLIDGQWQVVSIGAVDLTKGNVS
jgi:ATP phosphoribosyltransferase regulatory subunit